MNVPEKIEHFIGAMRYMRGRSVDSVEPTAEAQQRYVSAIDRRMHGTVWVSGGCRSWYLDATGRNSTLWPDSSWSFHRLVSRFRPQQYRAVVAAPRAGSMIGDRVVETA